MDPILLGERIFRGLCSNRINGLEFTSPEQLTTDLRELANWIEKGGFIPYVDSKTGKGPR